MALGGGLFLSQNKILPGSYINFVSVSKANANLSDRGYASMPLDLDFGVDDEVFTVTNEDFQKNSLKIFGYPYNHESLKGLRDLFKNVKVGYFYKLNSGGLKASNDYAKSIYTGIRGNDIIITIEFNELSTEDDIIYDVSTYLDSVLVDTQTVKSSEELKANDYVSFIPTATLELTAGTPLTGGTNGVLNNSSYQTFLDKIEGYSFNTLGCLSTDKTIKSLFVAFTKRMRDEVGVKFQTVLHRCDDADYEGIISIENNDTAELVYWVTGISASCAVNAGNTNKIYNGEVKVDVNYTQIQLENGIRSGKFMFHRVGDKIRVLSDINTFTGFTETMNNDFSNNQTIRVLDQIGNDIATIFNTKYSGYISNDNAGRISLWNDIVKHHQELEKLRAIEDFDPLKVTVTKGDDKKAVVVTDYVTPVNAMSQLYMTVVVS